MPEPPHRKTKSETVMVSLLVFFLVGRCKVFRLEMLEETQILFGNQIRVRCLHHAYGKVNAPMSSRAFTQLEQVIRADFGHLITKRV
jgi:hypothetical protein